MTYNGLQSVEGRANSKVVLAFTSFLLFCISSVVIATVLPFFFAELSVAEPVPDSSGGACANFFSRDNSDTSVVGMPYHWQWQNTLTVGSSSLATSHIHAVKRIFKNLKGQPKLGLWYPRDSPFNLEAYYDSDYAGDSLDKKSTTGEYVAAASCCGQVLWIQNEMLDYRFNLMNTKIYIDKESIICIVKNPVFYSKTKHIEIRHHFIRDSYEKKLIQTTAKVKKVNDQEQIQALVDNQKVIITKESIRRDLKFDDAEGIACLPNDTIFVKLARMGAKTTALNEFSSTMASAIICLANNQNFNFSNYIFDHMVKHLEGRVKFLMFLIFLQVFLDKQVKGMAKHKEIYVISSQTNKIFANMRRKGHGFYGNVTPLFEIMMVTSQEEVGEGLGLHIDSHHTPSDTQPSLSKTQKKMKPNRKQRQATEVHSPSSEIPVEESVPTPYNDPLPSEEAKIAQAKEISKLKKRVKKLEKRTKSRPAGLRRLKKVASSRQVESSEEKYSLGAQEVASKQERSIEDIDQDVEIALVDEAQWRMHDADMFGVDDLKGNEVFVKKIIEKEVSTVDPVITVGEVVTTASVEDSVAPTTATTADVDDELTLAKTLIEIKATKPKVARKLEADMRAKIEEEERNTREKDEVNRVVIEVWDDVHAIIDVDRQLAEQIQAQEREQYPLKKDLSFWQSLLNLGEKLKRCLEIFPGDDDDVAIETTPLSSKSPTIVYYKIHREGKKSYFKIINTDGDSQNYLTFRTIFKNLNREDLEVLRSIVKERFKKTKPIDDMENLLFQTLKTMFEPYVKDIIWKYQQGAVKVNNWKLFYSCRLYCVTTKTMVYYLLVEKMYPFTNNVLHQLWSDVRLQVDYEVEMAYDLLRLIRRPINKGYKPE
uniref:Putative reverse transcriptase, RNA-dependent DNA polymerase n=1 Tax=Tanacetum cinerariifolium TaxID=118510 RepID=A0A6L2NXN9_TANCI|nr:putative reverse transcriptase, RNA-dependent DNA polymerase [Tanacetum cinerariifolium]